MPPKAASRRLDPLSVFKKGYPTVEEVSSSKPDTLATIGVQIKVTPWDDPCIYDGESVEFIDNKQPFYFLDENRLEDGQIFYGLSGPVISGPTFYDGLICNLTLRADGTDWRKHSTCEANFTVGPSEVTRDNAFDFRHPNGLIVTGFPVIYRFGDITVKNTE